MLFLVIVQYTQKQMRHIIVVLECSIQNKQNYKPAGGIEGRGGGRHIGHKLRVGGDVGRYTRYSQVSILNIHPNKTKSREKIELKSKFI